MKAVEIMLATRGPKDPETLSLFNNIGAAFDSKGEPDKSLEYHLKALEIRLATLGPNHPDTGQSYHNIGSVYDTIGDNSKALEFNMRALDIFRSAFGLHISTAISLMNTGTVFHALGNNEAD
jgi:tetratricopeptide (TPR) repeat protein